MADRLADSIFGAAEYAYQAMKDSARSAAVRPSVMTGLPWKGSWYVPGGNSYAAAFIRDAGGEFIWEDAPQREALPMSLEAVYAKAASADIWINCGTAGSLDEIRDVDHRLGSFRPVVTGMVFNNTARLNPYGGNDIWESGVLKPHIILADLVSIFHPSLLPDHELVYYVKLK
jgi:iron complex transport system substrate-binding protein